VYCLLGEQEPIVLSASQTVAIDYFLSDGIARVHGMSNVQAEELVEYVIQDFQMCARITYEFIGSHRV
jgi:F0F1-type ATP synthase alpha subunit